VDVNDFWQENKRFVMSVATGGVVFLIGIVLINNLFGSELTDMQRRKAKAQSGLSGPLYPQADLDALRTENEQLSAAFAALVEAALFQPRPHFAAGSGSMSTRYFEVTSSTREELLALAGRMGVPVPEDLGLPALAPSQDEHIARMLEGLDVVDRTLRLAFEAGISRVESLNVKLDPQLLSGKPLKGLEKTLVTFKLRGSAASMARLSLLLQRSAKDRIATLERADYIAGGARIEDARLELVLAAVRLHESLPEEAKPKSKRKSP
jgi:hypothetical protein